MESPAIDQSTEPTNANKMNIRKSGRRGGGIPAAASEEVNQWREERQAARGKPLPLSTLSFSDN